MCYGVVLPGTSSVPAAGHIWILENTPVTARPTTTKGVGRLPPPSLRLRLDIEKSRYCGTMYYSLLRMQIPLASPVHRRAVTPTYAGKRIFCDGSTAMSCQSTFISLLCKVSLGLPKYIVRVPCLTRKFLGQFPTPFWPIFSCRLVKAASKTGR